MKNKIKKKLQCQKKAFEYNDIPKELIKTNLDTTIEVLFLLLNHIWTEEILPN